MPKTTHLLIANLDAETSQVINALCQAHNVKLTALCREDLLEHHIVWWVFGRHTTVDAIILAGHLPYNGHTTVEETCQLIRKMHPTLTIIVVSDNDSLAESLHKQNTIAFIHNNGNGALANEVAKHLHFA